MDRWEYKTVTLDGKGLSKSKFEFDAELNELGNEGWELVTMVAPISAMTASTVKLVATFKRKK